jgi:t-SNARE complex subunit (syntaxin)
MAAKLKKDDTQPIKQVFKVKGGIHAGRDVIQGNQTNYITYNAQQIANLSSPAEFLTVLQQVQARIAEMKKAELSKTQARNLEAAETLVGEVVEEAQKPQPALERIKDTLAEAKETMELLSGSVAAAATLGTTLGGLAATAIRLFGG